MFGGGELIVHLCMSDRTCVTRWKGGGAARDLLISHGELSVLPIPLGTLLLPPVKFLSAFLWVGIAGAALGLA